MNWILVNHVVETRFANEFLYWDKTGLVAKGLVEKFPRMEIVDATPGQTVLKDDASGVTLRYSYQIAHAMQDSEYCPTKDFVEYVSFFFPFVFRSIDISNLTRVGNRRKYHRAFESEAESKAALAEVLEKHAIGGSLLSSASDDTLKDKRLCQAALRYVDDKIGIRLDIGTATTAFTVSGPTPPGLKEHLPGKRYSLQLDVDIYTVKPIPSGDMYAEEFLRSNGKMLETRILPLLDV